MLSSNIEGEYLIVLLRSRILWWSGLFLDAWLFCCRRLLRHYLTTVGYVQELYLLRVHRARKAKWSIVMVVITPSTAGSKIRKNGKNMTPSPHLFTKDVIAVNLWCLAG
jgi:hypothetical protein